MRMTLLRCVLLTEASASTADVDGGAGGNRAKRPKTKVRLGQSNRKHALQQLETSFYSIQALECHHSGF